MNKQEMDRLYSPSQWSRRGDPQQVIDHFYQFTTSKTEEMRVSCEVTTNLRYAPQQKCLVDIYRSSSSNKGSPLFVFIHGGFWQEGSKEYFGFFKEFCDNGINLMVAGYDLAPQVSLGEIMEEMEQLSSFIEKYSSENNVRDVWLCGHSAGAQLALSLLKSLASGSSFISGIILISGVYQLTPVVNTYNNIKLRLSQDEAIRLSPMSWFKDENFAEHIKRMKLLIAVGEEESPAFLEQSAQFHEKLVEIEANVEYMVVPGCDHFNIVTDLYHKEFPLTSAILRLMLPSTS